MLLSKTVIIRWNNKTKKYYVEKGYIFTKVGEPFEVKIEDLLKGSSAKVKVLCDYCLEQGKETIIIKPYNKYIRDNVNAIIQKDCCKSCKQLKTIESNLLIYGVKSIMQTSEFKEKSKKTIKEKYGVEYISQSKEIQEKIKQTSLDRYGTERPTQSETIKKKVKMTNLERFGVENYSQTSEFKEKIKKMSQEKYGVDHLMESPEFRVLLINGMLRKYGVDNFAKTDEYKIKFKNTCEDRFGVPNPFQSPEVKGKIRQTMYKNGSVPVSKQQEYLHSIVGGELNFPFGGFSLDIAFPDEKIYIEYDGGGHALSVKLGSETLKEYNERNKRRWYALYRNGWKEIRIISKQDLLPSVNTINNMISLAKEYFHKGRTWVSFDIDKGIIENSKIKLNYDYGELKRVVLNSIKEV